MTKIKRPRGAMTWDEYEAWLKETGQYEEMVERHRKPDEELEKRWAACDAALVPLVEELRAAGCAISNLSDLEKSPYPKVSPWPAAIPILIAHLQQRTTYPLDARVAIASALSVSEMRSRWDVLLQLYRDEREELVKDAPSASEVLRVNQVPPYTP